MSSGCGDVLSLEDLKTAKKHQTFEAEVITGKEGGISTGAEIDIATNTVTGQTQKTMPAILRDIGFSPASFDFTTGGILTIADRDAVVFNPADNNWYSWAGALPHVVAAGTDPTADVNWKPRTDQLLRQDLASSSIPGTSLVTHSDGLTVEDHINNGLKVRLSYWGATASGLTNLLNYAVTSGKKCYIDSVVTLTSAINFDAAGGRIDLTFLAPIQSDSKFFTLSNLGNNSFIRDPWFQNVTVPYVISRVDADGNALTPGAAVVATLQQTNDEVGYQPTASDTQEWSSFSSAVQNQQICAGMIVSSTNKLTVIRPRGRYMALQFNQCNEVAVIHPNFMAGKDQYGSILFKNTLTTAWGYGNRVIGGIIRYGSVSGVVHMRNKGHRGGVWGGFQPFRVGESGVKTYQNNVDGRSARNYNLTYRDIFPHQCGYDGCDFFSDYGAQVERVDDYTIAQYAWNMLPTGHKVSNITATDCGLTGSGTGITADGQNNSYRDIEIDRSRSSGFYHGGANNLFKNIAVKDGNMNNAALGAQLRLLGVSSCYNIAIRTTASLITAGYALFATGSGTILDDINLAGTTLISVPLHPAPQNLYLGRVSSTDSTCQIRANPRPTILADAAGIDFNLLNGTVGAEVGETAIKGAYNGSLLNLGRGDGRGGGFFGFKMLPSFNAGYLNNGECGIYIDSTSIKIMAKLSDGTVKTGTLIA